MIKGRIVLIPFPFDTLSSVKVRPAVCLTDSVGKYKHVVVAFITSKIPDELLDSDVVIQAKRKGFQTSGLHLTSTIRLHRLLTISSSIIRRELGKVSSEIQKEIDKKLVKLFDL